MKHLAALVLLLAFSANLSAQTIQDINKKVVLDFYELAFNKHEPREATKKYFGDKYIQHNPIAADGAKAFYEIFEARFKANPKSHAAIKRVLADGDLVALHLHSTLNDKDPGRAIVDIFRLVEGKIVEHWDVVQPITTDKPANKNTMF